MAGRHTSPGSASGRPRSAAAVRGMAVRALHHQVRPVVECRARHPAGSDVGCGICGDGTGDTRTSCHSDVADLRRSCSRAAAPRLHARRATHSCAFRAGGSGGRGKFSGTRRGCRSGLAISPGFAGCRSASACCTNACTASGLACGAACSMRSSKNERMAAGAVLRIVARRQQPRPLRPGFHLQAERRMPRLVAVGALQDFHALQASDRQFLLQVDGVVEAQMVPGSCAPFPADGELRVGLTEIAPTLGATVGDPCVVFRSPWQSRHTPSSTFASCTRPRCSLVAGRAGGWCRLVRGVRRRVVAGQARLVRWCARGSQRSRRADAWHTSHFVSAKACALDTGPALYGLRLPAAAIPGNHSNARSAESPSTAGIRHRLQPVRTLEVVEVDPLRELPSLCGLACRISAPSTICATARAISANDSGTWTSSQAWRSRASVPGAAAAAPPRRCSRDPTMAWLERGRQRAGAACRTAPGGARFIGQRVAAGRRLHERAHLLEVELAQRRRHRLRRFASPWPASSRPRRRRPAPTTSSAPRGVGDDRVRFVEQLLADVIDLLVDRFHRHVAQDAPRHACAAARRRRRRSHRRRRTATSEPSVRPCPNRNPACSRISGRLRAPSQRCPRIHVCVAADPPDRKLLAQASSVTNDHEAEADDPVDQAECRAARYGAWRRAHRECTPQPRGRGSPRSRTPTAGGSDR